MKAVLISIQPKWCELIASGKKTVEVRKTKPKVKTPFKCYIYCTLGHRRDWGDLISIDSPNQGFKSYIGNGKVIGEFVCDDISANVVGIKDGTHTYRGLLKGSCLTDSELMKYGNWDILFGWNISDLVIYDKPKELSEFTSIWTDAGMKCKHKEQRQMVSTGERYFHCFSQNCICEFLKLGRQTDCEGYEPTKEPAALKKPPQSWCYVEEVTQ